MWEAVRKIRAAQVTDRTILREDVTESIHHSFELLHPVFYRNSRETPVHCARARTFRMRRSPYITGLVLPETRGIVQLSSWRRASKLMHDLHPKGPLAIACYD